LMTPNLRIDLRPSRRGVIDDAQPAHRPAALS